MELCKTLTPRGTRYYADGRRITYERYEGYKFRKRLDCFVTRRVGDRWRHYIHVSAVPR